jgi:hypothetical protein
MILDAQLEAQHVYGNFRQYYTFHPASSRLDVLPKGCFRQLWESHGCPSAFSICDVGCNEGELSLAMWERARSELPPQTEVVLLGVDIDPLLIARAIKRAATTTGTSPYLHFAAIDVMDESTADALSTAVVGLLAPTGSKSNKFNLVTLWSVTMWVHLNHGEMGLSRFLQLGAQLAEGSLLVEPQEKKSYKTAATRLRRRGLEAHHHIIEKRVLDNIEEHVVGQLRPLFGGQEEWKLGADLSWGRAIVLFTKETSWMR